MTDNLSPRDASDVCDAVQWALAQRKSLEIVGQGSKRAIGRPLACDLALVLDALRGVTLYEPEELVLTARAGTPIAALEALVAERGQQLAFEPMDYGPLLGEAAGQGSIGGVLAANLSGPRRLQAGAARDHFLGCTAVSGRGELFRSGGRVVKNVTGYDLCKLMAGSWGTLAALTEVTIKTLPRAQAEATVVIRGLADPVAVKAMTAAMATSCDVSAAAHLPSPLPRGCDLAGIDAAALTVLRLEGFAASVAPRQATLLAAMRGFGETMVLEQQASRTLWRAVRDVLPMAAARMGSDRPLWRISTAPAQGAELTRRLAETVDLTCLYDWAGGLVWMSPVRAGDDAGAAAIHRALAACGGHATLIRAPAALREAVGGFPVQDAALAALTRRVKDGFDPNRIFNAGRMWAGV